MESTAQAPQSATERLELPASQQTDGNLVLGTLLTGLGIIFFAMHGGVGSMVLGIGVMNLLISFLRKDKPYITVGADFIGVSGFMGAQVLFSEVQHLEQEPKTITIHYLRHGDKPIDARVLKLHLTVLSPEHQNLLLKRLHAALPCLMAQTG